MADMGATLVQPPLPGDTWRRVAAFSVAIREDLDLIGEQARSCPQLSAVLIDAKVAGLHGGRPAELAKELSTSIGAIYNLHYRANQLLRDCLQKEAS